MARAVSGTLTEDTPATVTLTNVASDGIEIINRSGSGTIWYRLDGTNPTVAGDNCHPVLGARYIDNPHVVNAGAVVVKLISNEALDYTVEVATPRWVRA